MVARPIGERHRAEKHRTPTVGRIRLLELVRVLFDVEDSDEPRFVLEIHNPHEHVRKIPAPAGSPHSFDPGDLIHIDVKKLGRIPDGGGWRALGREATSRTRKRKIPIGFDYVHAAVDDNTRLAYAEIHPDEKGATAAGFLTRAAAYFAEHGITRIERVLSDNAFAYRHSTAFKDAITDLGAKQKFIKPHCP